MSPAPSRSRVGVSVPPRSSASVRAARVALRQQGGHQTMTNDTSASLSSYPASYPPPAPPPYWQPRISAPVNGFAIAAMVLGIVWLYWLGSLLAVIFGHVALRQINDNGGGGRGMAIAGLVLRYVGLGTLAILIVIAAIAASSGTYA